MDVLDNFGKMFWLGELEWRIYLKNKIFVVGMAVLLVLSAFYGGTKVGAAQNTPGSAYDPLITQSYLEERLAQTDAVGFVKVNVAKNKILTLEAGGQLLILSGTANAVGSSGLVDMTEGVLLAKDLSVMKYHLCMAPAAGSGIKAATACTVFVTGGYTVK